MTHEIELVDAVTDYLYEALDMGGASTHKTKLLLDHIDALRAERPWSVARHA